jgi:site-specific DNA recombinase
VRFAFNRFADADLGVRDLARELEAKGYPSPSGKGWTHHNVGRLLRTAAYVGTVQWGAKAWGKYHSAQGEDIVTANGNDKNPRRKPKEDVIAVEGAHEGIIEPNLFIRVQAKLADRERKPSHRTRHFDYPLTGLIVCGHCGKPMCGNSLRADNRTGEQVYRYQQYVCATYAGYGRDCQHNTTCGRNAIDATRVLGWIVHKLQEIFLGPGRDALVQEIKEQLEAEPKANKGDVQRLEKRATDLDRQVSRLVKAIRTTDAAELVEELTITQAERDRVKAELAQASKFTDPMDLDTEAERITDSLWSMGERLDDSDPAVLREVLRQFVSRVTCRWEPYQAGRYIRSRLIGGTVELRAQTPFSVLGVVAQAS